MFQSEAAACAKSASEISRPVEMREQFLCGHSIDSWRCKGSCEEFGRLPKDTKSYGRVGQRQRGIRPDIPGDDSGCSVETGSERDRNACRGPRQVVVVGAGNSCRGGEGG